MERFITFEIFLVRAGDIEDSDKFGGASGADINDKFVKILHNEVEAHAGAALFLLDLVVSHTEATGEVGADFVGGEGAEAVANGDDELLSIAGEGEEAGFVWL